LTIKTQVQIVEAYNQNSRAKIDRRIFASLQVPSSMLISTKGGNLKTTFRNNNYKPTGTTSSRHISARSPQEERALKADPNPH